MTSRYERAKQAVKDAEAELKAALEEQIANCEHPDDALVEGEYYKSVFLTEPQFRVCRKCGYAEEGWGCGYWKLAPRNYNIPRLNRDAAWKYVTKFMTQMVMNDLRYGKRDAARV